MNGMHKMANIARQREDLQNKINLAKRTASKAQSEAKDYQQHKSAQAKKSQKDLQVERMQQQLTQLSQDESRYRADAQKTFSLLSEFAKKYGSLSRDYIKKHARSKKISDEYANAIATL
jgi:hypothetical protein